MDKKLGALLLLCVCVLVCLCVLHLYFDVFRSVSFLVLFAVLVFGIITEVKVEYLQHCNRFLLPYFSSPSIVWFCFFLFPFFPSCFHFVARFAVFSSIYGTWGNNLRATLLHQKTGLHFAFCMPGHINHFK